MTYVQLQIEYENFILGTYKEIEKEDTHNNTKNDPNDEGEDRVGNGLLSGVIISKSEDGDIRCADGK